MLRAEVDTVAESVMKENPFPGMTPWLESHWGDVHSRLTIYACDQLESLLPTGLRARLEEYVAVEAGDDQVGTRNRQEVAELYRACLDEPLPTIRIPLREDDADISLQIQPLIDAA